MSKIVIVNFGMGNIGSVVRKLTKINCVPVVADSYKDILSASKIILPGVGHFATCIKNLKANGMSEALNEVVLTRDIPILGICLGMQLMARTSEEGNEAGLGWVDAEVVRFRVAESFRYKIPHTGWNTLKIKKESPLLQNVDLKTGFYFVHSYHMVLHEPDLVVAESDYPDAFVSVIQKNNIYGVQFHPEKSHQPGEKILLNFLNL